MAQSPVLPEHPCPNHNSELYVLYCRQCEDLVCRKCVASSHSGHRFVTIEDVSAEKKAKIQDFIQKAEKNEVQDLQDRIKSVSTQVKENENATKILVDTIKSQGEDIKYKIEKITSKFIEICKTNTQEHNELLNQFKSELETLLSQMNKKLKNCKDVLRSGDETSVCEIAKLTERKLEIPTAPFLQNMIFTRGPLSNDLPTDGVGFLCKMIDSKLESEFMNTCDITAVEYANSGVWTSNAKGKCISLVNQQGEIKETIDIGSFIDGMSVSPKTNNVWCCCHQNSMIGGASYTVYEMLSSKRKKRFSLDSIPLSLCVTTEDNILVGTYNKVTMCLSTGEPLFTSDPSTVCVPNSLVISRSTGNIAVCDGDTVEPQVVVLDNKLKVKYKYHGLSKSQCHIFTSKFTPVGVVYDSHERLLVADSGNKCIQLVSDEGYFLSVIYRDKLEITVLTMIDSDRLFVVFDKRNVKIIKFPLREPL